MVGESIESIRLIEELIELSITDRVEGAVGGWGSNGPLKAVWVGGVQVNGLVQ